LRHPGFVSDELLRNKFLEIKDRIDIYKKIHSAAVNMLCEILRKKGKEFFNVDESNPGGSFLLTLNNAKNAISQLYLLDAIFLEVNPRKFIASETEKWGAIFQLKTIFP
jgi:hypothetical protein